MQVIENKLIDEKVYVEELENGMKVFHCSKKEYK